MTIEKFDRSQLYIKCLKNRVNDLTLKTILPLRNKNNNKMRDDISIVAKAVLEAKHKNSSIIFMIGAHVLRSGVQEYIIDLMKRGYVSCIAMNGGGMIHDYEFALIGATTENVSRYIKKGEFGLWKETAYINEIINNSYKNNKLIGMGYTLGKHIEENNLKYKSISVLAAGFRYGVPVTIHVGIGYDIIHEHPNCDGASTGALSYNDFLTFASVVQKLEGGVIMNFGSSVMAPEVFLKALSMARNIESQKRGEIKHFTSLVCDLYNVPINFKKEPARYDQCYYFRPLKTMLIRTVSDGGKSFYIKGKHKDTIPALWRNINEWEAKVGQSS